MLLFKEDISDEIKAVNTIGLNVLKKDCRILRITIVRIVKNSKEYKHNL